MTDDRIVHRRSKGPASTPAQRITELTSLVLNEERLLAEANANIVRLERCLARYETLGGVSFGGVAAAQLWCDFVMWESVLNENPQVKAIFELGTWEGGFSWWLWAQTKARKMRFYTFDPVKPKRDIPGFHGMDVFAQSASIGEMMRAEEPCIVFCDNGNKPRELRTYATELCHPGSLLIVHDWGTEMQPEDVPDTVEMIYEDFCKELGSISRVFRLKNVKDTSEAEAMATSFLDAVDANREAGYA